MQEEWRDIPGHEGMYKVSNHGRVMSMNYMGMKGRAELLRLTVSSYGYHRVHISDVNGNRSLPAVHRLVMLAFVGPSDLQVNHRDGVRTNNRLDNLEYCTNTENHRHSLHVLKRAERVSQRYMDRYGKKIHFAKLNESQVRKIKQLLEGGLKTKEIGTMFGVSERCIKHIATGANWAWVK